MMGNRQTSVIHGLTECWVFGNLLIVSAEHRALGDDGTMRSQSLQVFPTVGGLRVAGTAADA